jgi:predicted RNase H-like HicB family nuclease
MLVVMEIEYTVQIWQEGRQFVAHAMPLDVMSSGPSPELARKALEEAVHLFLVTARDAGTCEEILMEAGYVLKEDKWVSPPFIAVETQTTALTA